MTNWRSKITKKSLLSKGVELANIAADLAIRNVARTTFDTQRNMRPVYKVMISTPMWNKNNTDITVHRTIIADTSRPFTSPFTFSGERKRGSPILGLWVDQSDITEPDKAIIVMQNPFRSDAEMQESNLIQFPQFGIRNWLDIWMGFAPISPVGYASLASTAGSLASSILGAEIAAKVPLTYPDAFFFGNESHVFSGPIVSVNRKVGKGDRIQLVAFSPIIILRSMVAKKFSIPVTNMNVGTLITHVINNNIYKYGNIAKGKMDAIPYYDGIDQHFYMGMFPHKMFSGGNNKIRVSPINVYHNPDEPHFHTKPYKDEQDVATAMETTPHSVVTADIKGKVINKKCSLYDFFFNEMTNPTKTGGLVGLYAQVMPAFAKRNNIYDAFRDGEGHPGVFIKYGFKFETQDISDQIKSKAFDKVMKQEAWIGRNVIEMEAGVEYGTLFNTREVMTTDSGQRGKAKFVKVPLSEEFLGERDLSKDPFWSALLEDISIYGESAYPGQEWIYGKFADGIDITSDEIFESPIKNLMRRTYFSGMGGSMFMLGHPSFKPGRVLKVVDRRYAPRRAEDIAVNLIRGSAISKMKKSAVPTAMRLKGMEHDIEFYIWKTRHYMGVGSGYVSKVYFIEERNRSWMAHTESIDDIIKKAIAQQRQTLGMNK